MSTMNKGIKMGLLKNQISTQKRMNNNQNTNKDKMKKIVNSFNQGVLNKKQNIFKTSKNSPEKFLFENSKNLKTKLSNGNVNSINNSKNKNNNNNNNNNITNSKQIEKNVENLLKRKIIKIQEKKSITQANTNNNSINLSNNTMNHTITTNSLNNYLIQTNYISKMKNKISLDNSLKIKKESNSQKRSNSIVDDEKYYYYANSSKDKNNNYYNQYINSSSYKQYSNIKSTFNHIISKNNNNSNKNVIIPGHMKNSSLFSSTLNILYKPKNYDKIKFENKVISKTSNTSRKNSNEKRSSDNSYLKNYNLDNKNEHIKVNSNYYHNNFLIKNDRVKIEDKNNDIKKKKVKDNIDNGIKYNKNILVAYSKENSNSVSKNQSKNNSKDNILVSSQRKMNNENKKIKEKKIENIIYSKNKNQKESNEKNINNINNLNNKNKKPQEQKIKNNIKNNNNSKIINKGIKKDPKQEIKKEKDQKKLENKKQDCDIENEENLNDSFLSFLNSNLDINQNINSNITNTNTLNESYDSVQSYLKENGKYSSYNHDMEIISSYIKKFYQKNKKYPSTKMKFYKYGRLLGNGAFGKVNLSLHVLTGRLVAIKSINKTKLINERHKAKIQLETSIMKSLSSSNYIVKIYETYQTKKHFCIVMEYICAGDLLSYIKKRSKLNESIAKFIFKQIILSLQYIHSKNIVHRDIKLDNILIDLNNNIKICDFGVSKKISNNDKMFEQCGTPAYIAPEILKDKGYEGFSVDIWSCGVVLYAMLSGTVPFKGNNLNELDDLIIKGKFNVINDISNDAKHLIKCLLEVDPKKRITINNILNHPWLINVDVTNNKNYNLFTNAEKVLLAKSNVDYRDINNKNDMVEYFDLRNLDTSEEIGNKNINSKSLILAPFNSSMTNDKENEYDYNNKSLIIKNNVIKFSAKVKELNRNYELNNNGEIDNGIVISPKDSFDDKKKDNDISPYNYNGSYYSKIHSKPFSANNELEEGFSSRRENNKNESFFNENVLNELNELGYNKDYVKECILKNEINYATTSYYLLNKYYNE